MRPSFIAAIGRLALAAVSLGAAATALWHVPVLAYRVRVKY